MTIHTRPSEPEELQDILRIRRHPLVAPMQYPVIGNEDETWQYWLFGEGRGQPGSWTMRTILNDDTVIGWIGIYPILLINVPMKGFALGFDLHPDHWGKGIIGGCLQAVINDLYRAPEIEFIQIDVFRRNIRCIRAIGKLGFIRTGIPVLERLGLPLTTNCGHWILRFRLSREDWQKQGWSQHP